MSTMYVHTQYILHIFVHYKHYQLLLLDDVCVYPVHMQCWKNAYLAVVVRMYKLTNVSRNDLNC